MKVLRILWIMLVCSATATAGNLPPVQTVFVIVLENHFWADFKGSTNAPYLNGVLLPLASHCEQYFNPPGLHPSEPNYLWLEAGTNFGIFNNQDPALNHQNTTNHLTAQLRAAGISWKTYQEDIAGDVVPLTAINGYAPKHNPFVYFDDNTGTNDPNDAFGIAHIRPYSELAADLTNALIARYNFITPNLCEDGHDTCAPQYNSVRQADDWLASEVPKILNSAAYSNNGALFITWDEALGGDGPIGMLLLSPFARGGGYANHLHYTHSSFLRTIQEIFRVAPWLGDAANAADLSDLFTQLTILPEGFTSSGAFAMTVTGALPGTNYTLEASTNLVNWNTIATQSCSSNSFSVQGDPTLNSEWQFYRVRQEP